MTTVEVGGVGPLFRLINYTPDYPEPGRDLNSDKAIKLCVATEAPRKLVRDSYW